MSASKEKRERADLRETGSYRKLNEQAETEKKNRKRKTTSWVIFIVVIVLAIVVILFGTNILYGNAAAVTAGSEKYTAVDYNYFYSTLNMNYTNYYGAGMSGDVMRQNTLDLMQSIAVRANAAKAAGYTLSADGQATVDEQISAMISAAESNGADLNAYMAACFGRGVTEKVVRSNMSKWLLADEYSAYLKESYEFTDEELDAYYAENKKDIDTVVYNIFFVNGAATEADEENGIEAVSSEDAMAEALKTAELFVSRLDGEETFGDIAYDLAEESMKPFYEGEDACTASATYAQTSEIFADWLFDGSRRAGDHESFILESEDGTGSQGYYVVEFTERADTAYTVKNVRHILIKPEAVNSDDYDSDEAYNEAVSVANEAARAEAQDIYDEWLAGDKTEESFAALADMHSDDSSEGGLIENIYKGQTVEDFEDWCFDAHRKSGDNGIIESSYGYHIMYFVSEGDIYSRFAAREKSISDAYSTWEEAELANFPVGTTGMLSIADTFNVTVG